MTNDERRQMARAAILAACQSDDPPNQICDLMTNLLHLAASSGMSVPDLLDRAQMHYDAEKRDD